MMTEISLNLSFSCRFSQEVHMIVHTIPNFGCDEITKIITGVPIISTASSTAVGVQPPHQTIAEGDECLETFGA